MSLRPHSWSLHQDCLSLLSKQEWNHQDVCKHDCVKKAFIERYKTIPDFINAYSSDTHKIILGSYYLDNAASKNFKGMQRMCMASDCHLITYSSRELSLAREQILDLLYRFNESSDQDWNSSCHPSHCFLTNMISTFGIWFGSGLDVNFLQRIFNARRVRSVEWFN